VKSIFILQEKGRGKGEQFFSRRSRFSSGE
jgi:hypothetical protein